MFLFFPRECRRVILRVNMAAERRSYDSRRTIVLIDIDASKANGQDAIDMYIECL